MATKAEIRDRAAENLGLLPIGQSLASQHVTRIEAGYDEVYDQLKEEGLATWAEANEVPDQLVPWVAGLVALNGTETYPISTARYQRIVAKVGTDGSLGRRAIRRLTTPDHVSLSEPTDY